MKCCKLLADGVLNDLPFERTLATAFHDGPTEGFTECSQCRQVYSFRKLDWDTRQDVRILGLTPLQVNLETIAGQFGVSLSPKLPVTLVSSLDESQEGFMRELFAHKPIRVVAVEDWPGRSLFWRNIQDVNPNSVKDWFVYLGIERK